MKSRRIHTSSRQRHVLAACTGTDIELRIHTAIAPFDVAAEQWFPAAAGFAVTVIVHTVNAQTGVPRYLPPAEPAEWARAIFSTVDGAHGYFLGAVDPETGSHRRGQLVYRLYLDTDRQAIPVPWQVITCPHYRSRLRTPNSSSPISGTPTLGWPQITGSSPPACVPRCSDSGITDLPVPVKPHRGRDIC